MELKDFVQLSIERSRKSTLKSVDGLTWDELKWRPGSGANSIGMLLFHQARSEDIFIQSRILGKATVWEVEKWHEKMGLPAEELGAHYTVEQVNAFKVPDPKQLAGYADSVRARTVEYLHGMTNDKFDRIVTMQRLGDVSIGAVFAIIVVHLAEHAGDISYLRGLQRGMDK